MHRAPTEFAKSHEQYAVAPELLRPSQFSQSIYGNAATQIDDLLSSIREHGILVALTIAPIAGTKSWEVISGHRRLACALALGLPHVPCEVRILPPGKVRQHAVLDYNRQRPKTFSHLMREADALEIIWGSEAKVRRLSNLQRIEKSAVYVNLVECRNSDAPDESGQPSGFHSATSRSKRGKVGRTDSAIASYLGMGAKDLYRQARAVWQLAQSGDSRAQGSFPTRCWN